MNFLSSGARRSVKKVHACDLFILDELGPLELQHNQGWVEAIRVLDRRAFHAALVVIRPQLLEHGRQHWSDAKLIEIIPMTFLKSSMELLSKF